MPSRTRVLLAVMNGVSSVWPGSGIIGGHGDDAGHDDQAVLGGRQVWYWDGSTMIPSAWDSTAVSTEPAIVWALTGWEVMKSIIARRPGSSADAGRGVVE